MPYLFEPVVACVEVKLLAHWRTYSETAVMTLHAKTPTSAPDAAAVEEIVAISQTWVEDQLADLVSADWTIYSIYGESMAVNPPPFFAVSTAINGTQEPVDEPLHAPLILLHGPRAARTELGKSYVFAPGASFVGEAGYQTAYLADLVTAYQLLNTALADGGYNLAVDSKKMGQCVFVNSVTYSPRLTIQKRRRPGFGG